MTQSPIKLSLRTEGEWWVCYISENKPLADGEPAPSRFEISRVLLHAVHDPVLRQAYLDAMKKVISAACVAVLGVEPHSFVEEPPPEHEHESASSR